MTTGSSTSKRYELLNLLVLIPLTHSHPTIPPFRPSTSMARLPLWAAPSCPWSLKMPSLPLLHARLHVTGRFRKSQPPPRPPRCHSRLNQQLPTTKNRTIVPADSLCEGQAPSPVVGKAVTFHSPAILNHILQVSLQILTRPTPPPPQVPIRTCLPNPTLKPWMVSSCIEAQTKLPSSAPALITILLLHLSTSPMAPLPLPRPSTIQQKCT